MNILDGQILKAWAKSNDFGLVDMMNKLGYRSLNSVSQLYESKSFSTVTRKRLKNKLGIEWTNNNMFNQNDDSFVSANGDVENTLIVDTLLENSDNKDIVDFKILDTNMNPTLLKGDIVRCEKVEDKVIIDNHVYVLLYDNLSKIEIRRLSNGLNKTVTLSMDSGTESITIKHKNIDFLYKVTFRLSSDFTKIDTNSDPRIGSVEKELEKIKKLIEKGNNN